ncbi:MAG: ATP-dependent DNA helicase [Planctomycetota bacterium]
MSRLDDFNPADGGLTEPPRPRADAAPRAHDLVRDGIACLCVWASGSDVELDGVVHVAAARRGADGAWEGFEESTRPFAADGGATARILSEFGVDSNALSGAPTAAEIWPRLRAFVGARPVLCHDAETCDAWARQLDLEASVAAEPLEMVGLDEIASLLEPGFLSSLAPSKLVEVLVDAVIRPAPRGAILPPHVLSAAAELVARFGDRGPVERSVAAHGWARALDGFRGTDAYAARRLALLLALVDAPNAWGGSVDMLAAGRLEDGWIQGGLAEDYDPDDPLAELEPAVAEEGRQVADLTPLRADPPETAPFPDEDLALLDDAFRVHLPAIFKEATSSSLSLADLYRKSQHRVAEEVARCLGGDALLLVHAPTGTGKTLAYLVPALMWAKRHGVRVGIATYTRTLQSQAMEREVPRALQALARAGLTDGFRVALLKGREHSLCWRSLRVHAPTDDDSPETWLAWVALALFGLRDGEGDLDRFPSRAPFRVTSEDAYRRDLRALLGHVRGQPGCCTQESEKGSCAAEVARARAERSHVVITNQSFALARPSFFRRVVFDECEHLHDQAFNAWSHRITFSQARRLLERLHDPRAKSGGARTRRRPPLDRIESKVLPGTPADDRYRAARSLWTHASSALARLESSVLEYQRWRAEAVTRRAESEQHGLFREFVLHSGYGEKMVEATVALVTAAKRLNGALGQLMDELEGLSLRRTGRLRRALTMARGDLTELVAAVDAWLPVQDGEVRFASSMFNDVEENVRGEPVLAALVLLPGDALGRFYYPELGAAAFVSATTRLGGGFEKSRGYLGLDRVGWIDQETGEFDREAGTGRVSTFHAPEVFDYGRVLAGVPRGVPSVRDREGYLDFLGTFLPWYAERTRGRMLVLFTSLRDVREVAERAGARFAARGLPLLWQGMDAAGKEELAVRFRERVESTLLGVDTFWYGADFPGETLETLCIARLPYGVPDRYHHAQCAALGTGAQRERIYMPRALAKFRQGFGRLMRTATDRGVVLVLDSRVAERRHRDFLGELPVERPGRFDVEGAARLVRGDVDLVAREAFAHLGLLTDMERRGLPAHFTDGSPVRGGTPLDPAGRDAPPAPAPTELPRDPFGTGGPVDIDVEDLPF